MSRRWRTWCMLAAFLLTPAPTAAQSVRTDPVDRAGLPKGAVTRLGSLAFRQGSLTSLAFAPDGKTVAMASGAGNPALWDLATGRKLRSFDYARFLAFARDGKWLVTNVGTIDTATGKRLYEWRHNGGGFAVSPDGAMVAWTDCFSSTVGLLDVATGKPLGHVEVGKKAYEVGFSPDGRWLVATDMDAGMVHVWEVATWTQRGAFKQWICRSLAFAQGGKLLVTASADGKLRIHELPTGKLVRTLVAQKEDIWQVVASRDGSRVAAGLRDGVHVWDSATWNELRAWDWGRFVRPQAFTPDGKTLATAHDGDGMPRFWNVDTGAELHPPKGHRGEVSAVAFSPDGRTLWSLSTDHTARAWDWRTATELRCVPLGAGYANHLALTGGGTMATVAWHAKDSFELWDLASGKRSRRLEAPAPVSTHELSRDGRLMAWRGWQQKLFLWDLVAGKQLHQWPASHQGGIAFSADGTRLVFGEHLEDSVRSAMMVVDVQSGKQQRRLGIPGNLAFIAASPDGRLYATVTFNYGRGGELHLWDAMRWQVLYAGKHEGVPIPTFSPDGRLLALANMHRDDVRVLEVATGGEVRRFQQPGRGARSVAFTPDGRSLAVGDEDSTIIVWDIVGRATAHGAADLDARALANSWAALAGADAAKAFDAVWLLARAPRQSIPWLAKRIRPVAPADATQLARLINDLDSDVFDTRDRAVRDLAKHGELADTALHAALKASRSLEARRRIEKLLHRPQALLTAGEALRNHRVIHVLEAIGNTAARRVLQAVAAGDANARLTRDARDALRRLDANVKR